MPSLVGIGLRTATRERKYESFMFPFGLFVTLGVAYFGLAA